MGVFTNGMTNTDTTDTDREIKGSLDRIATLLEIIHNGEGDDFPRDEDGSIDWCGLANDLADEVTELLDFGGGRP